MLSYNQKKKRKEVNKMTYTITFNKVRNPWWAKGSRKVHCNSIEEVRNLIGAEFTKGREKSLARYHEVADKNVIKWYVAEDGFTSTWFKH